MHEFNVKYIFIRLRLGNDGAKYDPFAYRACVCVEQQRRGAPPTSSSQNRVKLFYCLPGKASKLQELNWPSVSQTSGSESSAQTSTTFIKQKFVNN